MSVRVRLGIGRRKVEGWFPAMTGAVPPVMDQSTRVGRHGAVLRAHQRIGRRRRCIPRTRRFSGIGRHRQPAGSFRTGPGFLFLKTDMRDGQRFVHRMRITGHWPVLITGHPRRTRGCRPDASLGGGPHRGDEVDDILDRVAGHPVEHDRAPRGGRGRVPPCSTPALHDSERRPARRGLDEVLALSVRSRHLPAIPSEVEVS